MSRRCPVHDIPDCSPLLNGCSRLTHPKRALTYARYSWALENIVEHTAIGYTLKSLDRLWIVMCFDLWSENVLYGNPIYTGAEGDSYDLWDDSWVFFSRRAAEKHAASRNFTLPEPIWMACNLGDLTRFDHAYLDRGELLRRGKYRGSDRVLEQRADLWHEHLTNPKPFAYKSINEENA